MMFKGGFSETFGFWPQPLLLGLFAKDELEKSKIREDSAATK